MGKRNGQNFMLQEEYSILRKLEAMPDRLISSASLREIGMIPKANNIRPITHIMLWGIPIAREYAHGKGISVFVHKSDVLKVLGNSEFVPLFMARKLIGLPRIGGGDLKIFAAAHEVSIDREFIRREDVRRLVIRQSALLHPPAGQAMPTPPHPLPVNREDPRLGEMLDILGKKVDQLSRVMEALLSYAQRSGDLIERGESLLEKVSDDFETQKKANRVLFKMADEHKTALKKIMASFEISTE
jgi:hypothetical protein